MLRAKISKIQQTNQNVKTSCVSCCKVG